MMLLARPSVGIGQCFPAQICNSCGQSNHQVDMDDPARNYLVWKNIRTNIESGVTLEGDLFVPCWEFLLIYNRLHSVQSSRN